mmetsp:Transcript_46005/g.103442  ORF Transcript_46005/g.103442 Transcript_46005/m.103442 type:complete len:206 (+) Transcript_46005:3497-4114(+)
MISSTPSAERASTLMSSQLDTISMGSRNSPGFVLSVTCLPAANVLPARRKNVTVRAASSHLARWAKNIQSLGSPLAAVLKSMSALPAGTRTIDGVCRMMRHLSLRSFAGLTVSWMTAKDLAVGGSNWTIRKSHWKPASMYGVLLIGSSDTEMASVPSEVVGAEIRLVTASFGDEGGSLKQQMISSVNLSARRVLLGSTSSSRMPV